MDPPCAFRFGISLAKLGKIILMRVKPLRCNTSAQKESGLRDLGVHSDVCKAASNDINRRLTIGFDFRILPELCWLLCWSVVIDLGLCLPDWQPVTFNRAIDDLLSYHCGRKGTGNRFEAFPCARQGSDLVHCH